jgi:hypothetical protein
VCREGTRCFLYCHSTLATTIEAIYPTLFAQASLMRARCFFIRPFSQASNACASTKKTTMGTTYHYQPLDHSLSQIRIFTSLPSTDIISALRGQLRIRPFSPTPPMYEALSYVWDDLMRQILIVEDGKELGIHQNLSPFASIRIMQKGRHNRSERCIGSIH